MGDQLNLIMKKGIFIYLTLFVFLALNSTAQTLNPLKGQWQGLLNYEETDVPFTFEISYENESPFITLINGEERIELRNVKIEGDSIFIPMNPFDAEIRAQFNDHEMNGVWKKGYKKSGVPFKANYGVPRYSPSGNSDLKLLKKLSINFNPEDRQSYPAVGLFDQQNNKVTGTILTDVGDFRYFEGVIENDSIKMSSFDGAHGFLMVGSYIDGKWSGDFYFESGYKEAWEGVYNENAELVNPFQEVESGQRPYFDILSAGDPDQHIDLDKYFEKVLIIQLFGTWCPNSFDETRYLVDWYAHHKNEELEILAVSFETNFSIDYGHKRIKAYKNEMQVPYDMVLGGPLNKGQAALAFPFIEKINAFPTLMILDKNGFVRYTHSYFNGPATGEYYSAFDQEFNRIIDALLDE
jgi:thiol-disulfide isomerase/thioredoxin